LKRAAHTTKRRSVTAIAQAAASLPLTRGPEMAVGDRSDQAFFEDKRLFCDDRSAQLVWQLARSRQDTAEWIHTGNLTARLGTRRDDHARMA
jgi:hypothetical protein